MKRTQGQLTVGLRLRGSRKELEKAVAGFAEAGEIELLPWRPDGGWPVPLARIASRRLLAKYAEKGKIAKRLERIDGGEVVPHFHFGDDVVLLTKANFKKLVGEVAQGIATELAATMDYEQTVDIMGKFAIDTVPLPE